MITKDDLTVGVKLKLLSERGINDDNKSRPEGTIITIKEIVPNGEGFRFIDTEGYSYFSSMLSRLASFDLVSSSLPTDRPLTYDETQMLQAGDVVKCFYGNNLIIKTVSSSGIDFENETRKWGLGEYNKDTFGDIYFVSRPEVKEEKRYEVKDDFKTSTFLGVRIHAGNVWTASTATGYDYGSSHKKVEQALNALNEKAKVKTTKSVSQILYGR